MELKIDIAVKSSLISRLWVRQQMSAHTFKVTKVAVMILLTCHLLSE